MGGESNTSRKAFVREVNSVRGLLSPQVQQLHVSFSREDLEGVRLPHCDVLAINLVMANYEVRRILMDNRSSVNILFLEAFENLMLPRDKLKPAGYTLHGFSSIPVPIEGIVTLDVTAGMTPHRRTESMDFMVVNIKVAYNAILGRPELCSLQDVPSAYHLKLKFSTESDVGVVPENQEAA